MVTKSEFFEKDYQVSKRIATLLSQEGIPRKFFHIITLTGTAIVWWLLLPIWAYYNEDIRYYAYTMFMINSLMTLVVYLIKLAVKRQRPSFKDDRYLSVKFDHYSFPSGHATRAAYVAILMPIFTPEIAWVWYLWALIMIISRLVLGVHYVSDIIAGIITGSFFVLFFYLIGWLPIFPFANLVV